MICKKHGEVKTYRAGRHERCSLCATEAVQRRRFKLKEMAVEYKGGKCIMCGYSKCKKALDFHHLDPSKKDFGISRKGQTISWERMKLELDKTILVCKNCHAEIHATLGLNPGE